MTLFTNTRQITGSEAEELFSAGISLLSCKAYPAAYLCFNHIPNKDFRLLYNKALCCFMVKWHDECYRLLCEAEQLMSGGDTIRMAELPEAFLHAARYSGIFGIQTTVAVKSGNGFQITFT